MGDFVFVSNPGTTETPAMLDEGETFGFDHDEKGASSWLRVRGE